MFHILKNDKIVKSYKRMSSVEKWFKERGIVAWQVYDKKTMPDPSIFTYAVKEV